MKQRAKTSARPRGGPGKKAPGATYKRTVLTVRASDGRYHSPDGGFAAWREGPRKWVLSDRRGMARSGSSMVLFVDTLRIADEIAAAWQRPLRLPRRKR